MSRTQTARRAGSPACCTGSFSEEVQRALETNANREQWLSHPCEKCGLMVGAKPGPGWKPEDHWPSVKYVSSKAKALARQRQTAAVVS